MNNSNKFLNELINRNIDDFTHRLRAEDIIKLLEIDFELLLNFLQDEKNFGFSTNTILSQMIEYSHTEFLKNIEKFIPEKTTLLITLFSSLIHKIDKLNEEDWEILIKFFSLFTDYFKEKQISKTTIQLAADLLDSKLKKKDRKFLKKYEKEIEKSLIEWVEISWDEEQNTEYDSGLVFYTVNSLEGSVFIALLRYLTSISNDDDSIIPEKIKNVIQESLSDEKCKMEYIVSIGLFFNFLFWLDQEWIQKNSEFLFSMKKERLISFFSGYTYQPNLSKRVFSFLNVNGIYHKLIDLQLNFKNDKRLTYDIWVGYIQDNIDFSQKDNLLSKLISSENYNRIHHLIMLFYKQKDRMDENLNRKLIILWEKLDELLNSRLDSEDMKGLHGFLLRWTILLDDLTENDVKLISSSLKHVSNEESLIFSEALKKHVSSHPVYIKQLLQQMMDQHILPDHNFKDFEFINTILYENDEIDFVFQIFINYLDSHQYFLIHNQLKLTIRILKEKGFIFFSQIDKRYEKNFWMHTISLYALIQYFDETSKTISQKESDFFHENFISIFTYLSSKWIIPSYQTLFFFLFTTNTFQAIQNLKSELDTLFSVTELIWINNLDVFHDRLHKSNLDVQYQWRKSICEKNKAFIENNKEIIFIKYPNWKIFTKEEIDIEIKSINEYI